MPPKKQKGLHFCHFCHRHYTEPPSRHSRSCNLTPVDVSYPNPKVSTPTKVRAHSVQHLSGSLGHICAHVVKEAREVQAKGGEVQEGGAVEDEGGAVEDEGGAVEICLMTFKTHRALTAHIGNLEGNVRWAVRRLHLSVDGKDCSISFFFSRHPKSCRKLWKRKRCRRSCSLTGIQVEFSQILPGGDHTYLRLNS